MTYFREHLVWIALTLTTCLFSLSSVSHGSPVACGALGLTQLDREHLKALAENPDCAINSPEDLLNQIPSSYFQLNTLVYQSHSLQGPYEVDYMNPRAIVYGRSPEYGPARGQVVNHGPDNRLIFSFNGRADEAGNNAIEFVELDPKGGTDGHQFFKYFEIAWPRQGGSAKVSGFNPPKCAACHGNPARPIFSVYPNWLGVYGSAEFNLSKVAFEIERYREFAPYARKHSRYHHLKPLIDDGFVSDDFSAQRGLINSAEALEGALEAVNNTRVARLIRETPQYDRARYAILGTLLGCAHWPSFIPDSVFASLEANMRKRQSFSPADVRKNLEFALSGTDYRTIGGAVYTRIGTKLERVSIDESERRLRQAWGENEFFFNLLVDTLKVQGPGHDNPQMAGMRLLMEGRNLDIGSWYLELVEPTYRTHNGSGALSDWAIELIKQDRAFDKFHIDVTQSAQDWPQKCSALRDASVKAMASFTVPPGIDVTMPAHEPYPQVFLNTCAQCHALPDSERGDLPFIPYDDPSRLENFLRQYPAFREEIWRKVNNPEGSQMPPYRMLTEDEIKSIGIYLNRSH